MKIGVFGGTFDPPHFAHLAVAQAARAQLGLDEVILMPANRNPLKRGGRQTPAKHRLQMVKLAIADQEGLAVSDLEITRGGPSYAVDTLAELNFSQPADYWFIVGADAMRNIADWKQPERLFKMCRLAVALRPPANQVDVLKRLPMELRDRLDFIEMPPMEISASDIRNRLALGENLTLQLPRAVLQYIQAEGLYKG